MMQEITKSNHFSTYDLGCAAALLSSDHELLHLDKQNPRKALFVFRYHDGIEDVVDAYLSDKLDVKARRFFDNIKALKNRLYGAR